MPLQKQVLKNTPRQVVIAIQGQDGQSTISMQEVLSPGQTLDLANASLTITSVYYTVTNFANVRRNQNAIINFNSGYDSVRFAQDMGFALNQQANSNITVNIGGGNNTIIFELTKSEGYNEVNRQALYPKDR